MATNATNAVTNRTNTIAIALIAAAVSAVASFAATSEVGTSQAGSAVAATDRRAIEGIVRAYILDHPEILPEAMERLAGRETAKAVAANRAIIETPYEGAWAGARDGDVTLVEFFDYACGYCRASIPDVDRLLREDPRLRVVYREMPVLGPDSEAATYLSLAVARTGRYAQFHRALFAAGHPDRATLDKLGQQFGIAPATAPTPATRQEVTNNLQLQNALRLTGTPSWVIGDKVLSGAVGYDALKSAIAEQRAKKG